MYEQVKFEIIGGYDDDIGEVLGGIGIYDGDYLVNVICGCCGVVFEPEDIKILERYEDWADLSQVILNTER